MSYHVRVPNRTKSVKSRITQFLPYRVQSGRPIAQDRLYHNTTKVEHLACDIVCTVPRQKRKVSRSKRKAYIAQDSLYHNITKAEHLGCDIVCTIILRPKQKAAHLIFCAITSPNRNKPYMRQSVPYQAQREQILKYYSRSSKS